MSEVTIQVRDNGPFRVEGPVKVVDADGNEFPIDPDKPYLSLCRCGSSSKNPFCDGAHKTCGFASAERA